MTDTDFKMTFNARLETLREQQALLESEARVRRAELLEELEAVCTLAGRVPRELLDGIIAGRRRGPKPGAKKAARKAAKKPAPAQPELLPEVTA